LRYPSNQRASASGENRQGGRSLAERADRSWQVQEARARLSGLIDEALAGRPQRISRRGKQIAVIISAAD
jgi:prevent-host-death family protein